MNLSSGKSKRTPIQWALKYIQEFDLVNLRVVLESILKVNLSEFKCIQIALVLFETAEKFNVIGSVPVILKSFNTLAILQHENGEIIIKYLF